MMKKSSKFKYDLLINKSLYNPFKPLENGASIWYRSEKSIQLIYRRIRKDLAANPLGSIKCYEATKM